ncbi:MAG TPA: NfeD family protein, partial [Candidatus Methylomirabilis sp.]|nr:NfeD family protein [Candidatus Methylomirabilis sp.]
RELKQAVAEGQIKEVLTRGNGHLQRLAQRLFEKEAPEGEHLRWPLADGKAAGLPVGATVLEASMWCHLILFAPVLALPLFWLLPLPLALPIYGVVVGLTALIAWPVVTAMRRPTVTGSEGMRGAKGEALTELNPHGLIRCRGEVWSATANEPIPAGERVQVLAVDRLHARVVRQAARVG